MLLVGYQSPQPFEGGDDDGDGININIRRGLRLIVPCKTLGGRQGQEFGPHSCLQAWH